MKNKNERKLAISIIIALQAKRFEDWLRKNGLFGLKKLDKKDELLMQERGYTQVIEPEECIDLGIEVPETKEEKIILDFMSYELTEQYEKDIVKVHTLFSNESFMKAYTEGNNDRMLSLIESFYYEGHMDYELLVVLERYNVVTLSEENITHFKKIGLIPTFNNGDNGTSLS